METRILIMRPEQPNHTRTFELPETPSADDLAGLIKMLLGCDYYEHVTVLADFDGGRDYVRRDMFVDEMGHPKRLPRNENATVIYRRNAVFNHGVTDAESLDWIAGPAVLFDRLVWF